MFTATSPLTIFWQKILQAKVKIVAAAFLMIGTASTVAGFSSLYALSSQEYQLEPVMTECNEPAAQKPLFVDVGGAVSKPGLYQLQAGDRIGDALEKAGGITAQANTTFVASSLNAAAKLSDGDKIFIPHKDAKTDGETVAESAHSEGTNLISINNASAKELTALPGIGEKRAGDIVANRPYKSIDELVGRKVITTGIMDDIAKLITL